MDGGEPIGRDEERIVVFSDDESLLPEPALDDLGSDLGANRVTVDDWLRGERPPHWE